MAAEISSMPVNGNYAPHQGYGAVEQNSSVQSTSAPSQPSTSNLSASTSNGAPKSLDVGEIGWYFVEQYYTTLSKSPDKLHNYHHKRSQFVSGHETDKVAVCVGQAAIAQRIKDLDFQDCKVRVTNVDTQSSDANIVIQVIGEISNKNKPHEKFTQTFVLAPQKAGYFVLNDIFRYLVDEEDEFESEENQAVQKATQPSDHRQPTPTIEENEPKSLTSSEDPAAVENDAAKLDEGLNKKIEEQIPTEETNADQPASTPPAATNGTGAQEHSEAETGEPEEPSVTKEANADEPESAETNAESSAIDQPQLQPETPKDPEPTPAASPPKQTPAQPSQPAAPPKPAVPKTWASLAASAHRTTAPAVPATPSPATSTTSQTKVAPSAPKEAPTGPSAPSPQGAPAPEVSPVTSQQDEWTSVGDHKRQQSRAQQGVPGTTNSPAFRGYVKNVTENVDSSALKRELEKYGEVMYFDVAPQKNCAFVDFKTQQGYEDAIKANPHSVSGSQLYVEERRFKPGAYPYVNRGGMRGGRGGPGQGQGRGGFPPRGGFNPRGRGGAAPRGRGGPPAV
ncbi:hypothetical protein LTR66_004156 [Elasticomyces elasticus]|nr:hypothetical protein LTR66_004156 [Elasticomyces elasticus]